MPARGLELKIPPLALVLLFAGAMALAAWGLPRLNYPYPGRVTVGSGLAAAGVLTAALGIVAFRRARTTVNPMSPESASSLVIVGIYKRTRNPMYLGFLLMLAGLAAGLASAVGVVLVPVFALYLTRYQILPEERALEARFGADFVSYKARVRRWI